MNLANNAFGFNVESLTRKVMHCTVFTSAACPFGFLPLFIGPLEKSALATLIGTLLGFTRLLLAERRS